MSSTPCHLASCHLISVPIKRRLRYRRPEDGIALRCRRRIIFLPKPLVVPKRLLSPLALILRSSNSSKARINDDLSHPAHRYRYLKGHNRWDPVLRREKARVLKMGSASARRDLAGGRRCRARPLPPRSSDDSNVPTTLQIDKWALRFRRRLTSRPAAANTSAIRFCGARLTTPANSDSATSAGTSRGHRSRRLTGSVARRQHDRSPAGGHWQRVFAAGTTTAVTGHRAEPAVLQQRP
jgi:hypothetical protein